MARNRTVKPRKTNFKRGKLLVSDFSTSGYAIRGDLDHATVEEIVMLLSFKGRYFKQANSNNEPEIHQEVLTLKQAAEFLYDLANSLERTMVLIEHKLNLDLSPEEQAKKDAVPRYIDDMKKYATEVIKTIDGAHKLKQLIDQKSVLEEQNGT